MKRLILMRHGDAPNVKEGDRFRLLSEKGMKQSREAGDYLVRAHITPDLIYVSPVERTMKTLECLASAFKKTPLTEIQIGLYAAPKEQILRIIEKCPADINTLLVIGHNPGISELLRFLPIVKDEHYKQVKEYVFPEGGLVSLVYEIDNWGLVSVSGGLFEHQFVSH
jgi:phosphohistidine phosphatase